ncbi:hypothetical protein [Umezawaea sp. Da 62-37]|uniref:hypothetical protein n=1 Tax=Umezawaea sp. Da 62-37 TaxID=3075927 RepID=UPI0028F73457|nr:hypothetical protein [Umezawaea sp. Da 62-37]WNV86088.1 hypothetical protein RM788_49585 [Umezawaea sp. Da 62-37]
MPRLVAAALAVVLVLVVDGTASAHWGGSGDGAESATTGTAVPVELGSATPAATLRPGASADVVLVVANRNPFTVHFGSIVLDTARGSGGFTVDEDHLGCSTAALGFTARSTGWTAPAADTLTIILPEAITMGTTAANACQGAIIAVHLVVAP